MQMNTLLWKAALLGAGIALAFPAQAEPSNQAECQKRADTWFASAYDKGSKKLKSGRSVKASLRAHFNGKLQRCMIRGESASPASGKDPANTIVSLYDGDPKYAPPIASLVKVGGKLTHCDVRGKRCDTAEEWEAQVAPLMKE